MIECFCVVKKFDLIRNYRFNLSLKTRGESRARVHIRIIESKARDKRALKVIILMTPRGDEESKVRSKLKVGSTERESERKRERETTGKGYTRSVKVREPTPSSHDRGTLLFILVLSVCTAG